MAETLENFLSKLSRRLVSTDKFEPANSKVLYADYALLAVDPNDSNVIHGNWRHTAAAACAERTVDRHVFRTELSGYDYEADCSAAGSQGVWRFTLV